MKNLYQQLLVRVGTFAAGYMTMLGLTTPQQETIVLAFGSIMAIAIDLVATKFIGKGK